MTRLASRFGRANVIRRDRPLTREELFCVVPSVFSEDKHASRSERYTCIPTITLLENLQREGFQPFFACQTRVRDQGKREHTKHMLRLRREGQITGHQVPEIILLNSHDGSSSYQMLPGLFRMVCQNGLICGESFGEVRVPHIHPTLFAKAGYALADCHYRAAADRWLFNLLLPVDGAWSHTGSAGHVTRRATDSDATADRTTLLNLALDGGAAVLVGADACGLPKPDLS